MIRNKKRWLKVALLVAFCQIAFLASMTTQAEEIAQETTVSQVSPTSNEVEVQSDLPKETAKEEISTEFVPATEAPSMNEKSVLDETIGKSQQPGDSPVVAVETPVEAPEAQVIPEKEKSLEESGSTEINEGSEPVQLEDSKEATTPIELTKEEMDSNTSLSSEKEEKTVLLTEPREPELKKVEESGDTQKETIKKETVSPTSSKEVTLIVPQTARSARVRRATNTAVLGGRKIDWGENIGVTSSPNNPNFTLNYMVRFEINGQVAFCIEPGVAAAEGQVYTATALENYLKDLNIRKKTSLISYLGYVTSKDKSDEQYIAAQFMIWEVLGTKIPIKNIRIDYDRRKAEIQRLLNNFDERATFHNQTHTVKIGETLKVKSGNDFLQRVKDIQKPKGVNVSIHDNEVWITITKEAPEKAKIHFNQIEALGVPLAYRRPGAQTIGVLNPFVPGDSVVNLTILKQGNIRVFKEDAETGVKAQGAASLENAVYGLYQANGKKIKEITLKNINGKVQAEIKDLDPGKYVLKEIKAPKGYVLSDEAIEIVVEPGKTVNTIAKDQVIKGTIDLVKVANKDLVDSTNPDNKPKLAGIEISLTSKTTGKVVKTVVTDNDGYATFGKNTVVFDTYILSETKGKEGYKLFEPFEVTISENGQTFHYVLEDKVIEQRLKVVKVDQETGKVIALSGTQFKIWDKYANNGKGGYVSMALPNDTEVSDIFTTNEKGYFVTTDTLKYGKNRYELREIKAPEKYVLNKTPYVFSVTDDTNTIQLIYFANRLAKANVEVFKYDTSTNFDQKTAIAGVEFDLFKKDETGTTFVGTFKTDKKGKINVKDLLVGDYFFKEVKPLDGYLALDKDVPFTVTVDKDGTVIALEVENKRIPPKIGTTAIGKYTNQQKVTPLKKVTITDTVKYSNLIIGKTYTVNGVLMDKEESITAGKDVPLLVNGKQITASKVFVAKNPNGMISLDFVFDASALAGKEIVVFENIYRDGRLVASHTDIHDKGQTVRIVNPMIHTKATGQNGEKQLQALPNQKVKEWVQLNDLIVGQTYKVLVQGYITPDGVKLDGTSAEKIFKADKTTLEFLFEFLVDGRKLAGKGLSFAEWLEAQSEPKDENDYEVRFEQIANHNVDLKSEDQTVYFVEVPKVPEPKIPEKSQPFKEVKQASVVPMLPKTGSEDTVLWMIIGVLFVLAAGLTFYELRKVKD
ncbi:VaFE repeat-containing surface-anchored protein [Enterococcus avium]|uniref:SpaA isopeptide-forming pilin-related protein n=1 Tax=Enterococcus avium TaxID=33945 RepID=UPI001D061A9F|nr:SpaA isopeptide-forming pilin-related protein [Enterococcus avium]MCB6530502.1 VaFE repeat-containing surface-anchored protein [Enterococcus avium]MCG4868286.1 VaFE repeat-containing surface-anchored protein [Enterococcus avium]MCQ4676498.1 SpaA isopeptide-forming pilin-related protein [Enterococcus avium]